MQIIRPALALTFIAAATVSACRPSQPPAPVTPAVDSAAIERARQDSIARAQAEADRLRREREAALAKARADSIAAAERVMAELRNTLGMTVYFDFDQDAIRNDQRATLEAKLPILSANADLRLRITGHADERGSDEYNLALGLRRASVVRRFFTERGIAESRLEIVTRGEEAPVCTSSDESCWSRNRRAEFEILAGGSTLRRP
jgi:peptidoglycan-associated lipoprotein